MSFSSRSSIVLVSLFFANLTEKMYCILILALEQASSGFPLLNWVFSNRRFGQPLLLRQLPTSTVLDWTFSCCFWSTDKCTQGTDRYLESLSIMLLSDQRRVSVWWVDSMADETVSFSFLKTWVHSSKRGVHGPTKWEKVKLKSVLQDAILIFLIVEIDW